MIYAEPIKAKQTITSLLGGKDVFPGETASDLELVFLSKKGLKKASVDSLANYIGLTKKEFAESVLNLSVKTIERKKHDGLLDSYTSSYIIEIAKVVAHAFDVFESEKKVQLWLGSPILALNNMKPIDLFNTPTGLSLVNTMLGRIEEGIFS